MKSTQIDGQVLILDESSKREYKYIMVYERYVAANHTIDNKTDIKQAIRQDNQEKKDESTNIV